ncbi:vacuolar iron transporter homolog 4-like [Vigna unguiculata]|nr:vacuolar iron transporter homolog 4-like [Vigna unguiculata]
MMGVGGVERDDQSMILSGVAGLVAGACSMAIGEFVSVSSQYDIELAQLKREGNMDQKHKLPNPYSAAFASALAFSLGAGVPLLASASVSSHRIRMAVLAGVVTLTLIVFGALSGCLGKVSRVKFICRILIGGWMAMAVTFGLTKLVNDFGILLT